MSNVVSGGFREFLTQAMDRGLRLWGIPQETASPEAVRESVYLADEATLLRASGLERHSSMAIKAMGAGPLREALEGEAATAALVRAGEALGVRELAGAVPPALGAMQGSLAGRWGLGRLAQGIRGLPLVAVSQFSPQALGLEAPMGEGGAGERVRCYAEAFCRRDSQVLGAVERAVLEDPALGPLVLELSSRLLEQVGRARALLPEDARAELVSSLALMAGELSRESAGEESASESRGRTRGTD